jgi:hypothetical protein
MTIHTHLLIDVLYLILGIVLCLFGRNYWEKWKKSLGITCWDECAHPLHCWRLIFLKAILAYGAGLALIGLSIWCIVERLIILTGP